MNFRKIQLGMSVTHKNDELFYGIVGKERRIIFKKLSSRFMLMYFVHIISHDGYIHFVDVDFLIPYRKPKTI